MAICPAGPCSRGSRLEADAKRVVALYVALTGLPYSDLVVRRHGWTCEGTARTSGDAAAGNRRLAHMAIDREVALGTLRDRAVKHYVDAWEGKHRPSRHREMAQGDD